MSEESLLTALDSEGIFWITINRPQVKNAVDLLTQRLLRDALLAVRYDPGVRVVVLQGAGDAFCTGGDVNDFGRVDAGHPLAAKWGSTDHWPALEFRTDRLRENTETSNLLYTMPKPTIAMVRGPAAGAGMSLALACDFRIGGTSARFISAFAKIGTSGDYGGTYFLTQLVGPSKAKEIYMLGERIEAEEAFRLGLLNRLVEEDKLEAETAAFANALASGAPIAQRYVKANINAALCESHERVLEREANSMMRTIKSEDSAEAIRAFKEKRPPKFEGK